MLTIAPVDRRAPPGLPRAAAVPRLMPDALEHRTLPPPGNPDTILLDLARAVARLLAREHDAAEQETGKTVGINSAEG
jgi:hypothetical protein